MLPPPRARPDELEGLLRESDDAETLSLHSNIGDERRRRGNNNNNRKQKQKKRRRAGKGGLRVFGFDLFGRSGVQLPESDDEEGNEELRRARAEERRREEGREGEGGRERTVSSTSTLDSDAALLDVGSIAELSAARAAAARAQAAAEEEKRKAKEERRRLRRERKELKRMAMALSMGQGQGQGQGYGMQDEEFEGFQVRRCFCFTVLSFVWLVFSSF